MSKEVKAAIIVGAFAVVAAIIGYLAAIGPTQMSIEATQTAENKQTLVAQTNVDPIVGNWTGIEGYPDGHFQTKIDLSIQTSCSIGSVCGTVSYPELGCSGNLSLARVEDEIFVFLEQILVGDQSCTGASGGFNYVYLLPDGSLSVAYRFPDGRMGASGVLKRP